MATPPESNLAATPTTSPPAWSPQELIRSRSRHRSTASATPSIAPTDGELLMLFTRHQDEQALTRIIERHGPMVWRVCRGVLLHQQDAEDSYQATFLILARNARSIRAGESIAGWLFRVAHRTSISARRSSIKRREEALAAEPLAPPEKEFPDLVGRQMIALLLDELHSLPAKYQTPLVMRYLEGRSRRSIAEATETTIATVQGQLARGKKMLRSRLVRRGVSLSAAMALASGTASPTEAASSHLIAQTTADCSTLATGSGSLAASATVLSLYREGVRAMFFASMTKPTAAVACVLLAALFASPLGVMGNEATATGPAPTLQLSAAVAESESESPATMPPLLIAQANGVGEETGATAGLSSSAEAETEPEVMSEESLDFEPLFEEFNRAFRQMLIKLSQADQISTMLTYLPKDSPQREVLEATTALMRKDVDEWMATQAPELIPQLIQAATEADVKNADKPAKQNGRTTDRGMEGLGGMSMGMSGMGVGSSRLSKLGRKLVEYGLLKNNLQQIKRNRLIESGGGERKVLSSRAEPILPKNPAPAASPQKEASAIATGDVLETLPVAAKVGSSSSKAAKTVVRPVRKQDIVDALRLRKEELKESRAWVLDSIEEIEALAEESVRGVASESIEKKRSAIYDLIKTIDEQIAALIFSEAKLSIHTTAATPIVDRNADYGYSVELLQKALNEQLDPSPQLDVDGDYGPKTEAAVQRFKKQAGIQVDGDAGPQTRKVLGLTDPRATSTSATRPLMGKPAAAPAPQQDAPVLAFGDKVEVSIWGGSTALGLNGDGKIDHNGTLNLGGAYGTIEGVGGKTLAEAQRRVAGQVRHESGDPSVRVRLSHDKFGTTGGRSPSSGAMAVDKPASPSKDIVSDAQGRWRVLHKPSAVNPDGWATIAEMKVGGSVPIPLPEGQHPRPHLKIVEIGDAGCSFRVEDAQGDLGEKLHLLHVNMTRIETIGDQKVQINWIAGSRDTHALLLLRQITGTGIGSTARNLEKTARHLLDNLKEPDPAPLPPDYNLSSGTITRYSSRSHATPIVAGDRPSSDNAHWRVPYMPSAENPDGLPTRAELSAEGRAPVLFPGSAPIVGPSLFVPQDRSGYSDRNADYGYSVELLQKALNEQLDPSPQLDVDGDYGPKTEAAVQRFQKQAGIQVDGDAGPQTRKVLGLTDPRATSTSATRRLMGKPAAAPTPQQDAPVLAFGDKVEVSIWGGSTALGLNGDGKIDHNGTLNLGGSYGTIEGAGGKTLAEAQKIVAEQVRRVSDDPTVRVRLTHDKFGTAGGQTPNSEASTYDKPAVPTAAASYIPPTADDSLVTVKSTIKYAEEYVQMLEQGGLIVPRGPALEKAFREMDLSHLNEQELARMKDALVRLNAADMMKSEFDGAIEVANRFVARWKMILDSDLDDSVRFPEEPGHLVYSEEAKRKAQPYHDQIKALKKRMVEATSGLPPQEVIEAIKEDLTSRGIANWGSRKGFPDRNEDYGYSVKLLQKALNEQLDPSPHLSIDGDYGPMTKVAVRRFQKQANLKVNGDAGPETRKVLGLTDPRATSASATRPLLDKPALPPAVAPPSTEEKQKKPAPSIHLKPSPPRFGLPHESIYLGELRATASYRQSPGDLPSQFENRLRKFIVQRSAHALHNHAPIRFIVGHVVVEGPEDAALVTTQMRILRDGYFFDAISDISRPVGFRMHGYDANDLSVAGNDGLVIDVGEVRLTKTSAERQRSIVGKIRLEGNEDLSTVKITLKASHGPFNNYTNGYESSLAYPERLKATVNAEGQMVAKALSPIKYHLYIEAYGYERQWRNVDLSKGTGDEDLGTITLKQLPLTGGQSAREKDLPTGIAGSVALSTEGQEQAEVQPSAKAPVADSSDRTEAKAPTAESLLVTVENLIEHAERYVDHLEAMSKNSSQLPALKKALRDGDVSHLNGQDLFWLENNIGMLESAHFEKTKVDGFIEIAGRFVSKWKMLLDIDLDYAERFSSPGMLVFSDETKEKAKPYQDRIKALEKRMDAVVKQMPSKEAIETVKLALESLGVGSPQGLGRFPERNADYGYSVELLQKALNKQLDPSPELDVDGDYGPKTEAAIRRFKKEAGLSVDGSAGPETRKALGLTDQRVSKDTSITEVGAAEPLDKLSAQFETLLVEMQQEIPQLEQLARQVMAATKAKEAEGPTVKALVEQGDQLARRIRDVHQKAIDITNKWFAKRTELAPADERPQDLMKALQRWSSEQSIRLHELSIRFQTAHNKLRRADDRHAGQVKTTTTAVPQSQAKPIDIEKHLSMYYGGIEAWMKDPHGPEMSREEAERTMLYAISRKPHDEMPRDFSSRNVKRGWERFFKGLFSESEASFRFALEEDEPHLTASNGLGFAMLSQGKAKEAKPVFEGYLEREPGTPGPMHGLACCLAAEGDREGAIRNWEEANKISPGPWTSSLARAYFEEEEYAKAVPLFEMLVKVAPRDKNFSDGLKKAKEGLAEQKAP